MHGARRTRGIGRRLRWAYSRQAATFGDAPRWDRPSGAGLEPLLRAAGLDEETATTTGFGRPVTELVKRAAAVMLWRWTRSQRWEHALPLGSAVNLLSPQAVTLGGFFAPIAQWLLPAIDREFGVHVIDSRWGVPCVLTSTLGPEAAVRGAAALSLHRVRIDPALVADVAIG